MCFVESWLSDDILDTEISLPNYSAVRLDQNRGSGIVLIIILTHCMRRIYIIDPPRVSNADNPLQLISPSQTSYTIALPTEVLGMLGRQRTKALQATRTDCDGTSTRYIDTVQLYIVASTFYMLHKAFSYLRATQRLPSM